MTRKLTESQEDYLEAIAELIMVSGHAHTKEIADKLHVKMPSVTAALRQLVKSGYILYNTHYPVVLTEKGKIAADEVIHCHQVLKKFFSDVLGLPADKASETACHLEHVVDSDTIQRFVLFSEAIENRCDARNLQKYLTEAIAMIGTGISSEYQLLSKCSRGKLVEIVKFSSNLNDSELPRGLTIGKRVTIEGLTLNKESFRIILDESMLELPLQTAENIWAVVVS